MSENVIFCYSGTGNCLDMAKTIARELGDTDIILMRREPAVTDVRDARRVGFVFPCYGGGLPGGVEEIGKVIGGLAQSPDAVGRRQGKYRHQNAAATIHMSVNSLIRKMLCFFSPLRLRRPRP